MKSYKIPALLMIIHGGFMELGGVFCMIPALIFGTDKFDIGKYFAFKLSYLQDNLYMMMIIGAIYGIFRLIGAIGLLKNRMWGLVLSVIMRYHNNINDVFASCRNNGWNTRWQRFDINFNQIFWK